MADTRQDTTTVEGHSDRLRERIANLRIVAVFCASRTPQDEIYNRAVEDLAGFMVENGIRLVYGGVRAGMMGQLARSVLDRGGEVTGVFARCLPERLRQDGLTETVFVDTLAERKSMMIRLADAAIALPGGAGTVDELTEAITLRYIEGSPGFQKPVGVYNVGGYFDSLLSFFDHARGAGFSRRCGHALFAVGYTARELFERLVRRLPSEMRRKRPGGCRIITANA